MAQEIKKLKVVVVGVGTSGYHVTELLEKNTQTKDLNFIYVDKPNKGIKTNSTCRTITLYSHKPCTLEEAKSEFLRWELSTDNFDSFELLLEEGDQIYLLTDPTPVCCGHSRNQGVKIKRNGKFIHTFKFDFTNYNEREKEKDRERELEKLRCAPKVLFGKAVSLFKK